MDNPNGPFAFPAPEFFSDAGMSLRDYFAGQALVGLLAQMGGTRMAAELASEAYQAADAMMAERERRQG